MAQLVLVQSLGVPQPPDFVTVSVVLQVEGCPPLRPPWDLGLYGVCVCRTPINQSQLHSDATLELTGCAQGGQGQTNNTSGGCDLAFDA